ncbi:MAG: hypothetical protein KJ600_02455 [Nanoarchaeota archaeon]|nr:hypothetical protein [Nanoarchaeota archaeon]
MNYPIAANCGVLNSGSVEKAENCSLSITRFAEQGEANREYLGWARGLGCEQQEKRFPTKPKTQKGINSISLNHFSSDE